MSRDFVDLKDGDQLAPYHINILYHEAKRLRKMTATLPLVLEGIESAYSNPKLSLAWYPRFERGKVTTAIPTGTISSPSNSGRATLYVWDGHNSTAGEADVIVMNDHTLNTSIAVNSVVKLALIDCDYWLVQSDC